jgi:hypothetical protein
MGAMRPMAGCGARRDAARGDMMKPTPTTAQAVTHPH